MSQTPQTRVLFKHTLSRLLMGVFAAFLTLSISASVITLFPHRAEAATSKTLNFQARLLTAGGSIVPDGTYNVEFKLYDSQAAGGSAQGVCAGGVTDDCLWRETRTGGNKVTVRAGYLSVYLGDITDLPSNIWTQQLWLSMNIGGTGAASWDGEMSPRLRLTAVPAAYSLTQYNSTTGFSSSLSIAGATGGDQTFIIPDQGASGTFSLLTNASGIQNQIAVQQSSSNFWISGTGRADTSFLTPTLDTPSGTTTLNVGTTNATAGINLNQNTSIATGKTLTVTAGATSLTGPSGGSGTTLTVASGAASNVGLLIQAHASQSTDTFRIRDGSNNVTLAVDATGSQLTLGTLNTVAGKLVINDGGSNFAGTILTSTLTADRRFILPDTTLATTGSPGTICVYNGTNSNCPAATGSTAYIQNNTTVQTSANFYIRSAATSSVGAVLEGANGQTANLLNLNTYNGTTSTTVARFTNVGNLDIAGTLDTVGSTTLNLGTSTATGVSVSKAGATTTVNGALTVAEATSLNGNLTVGNANTDRLTVTSQVLGQDALVFQGATDDANTTAFRITDPTGSNIITFPDATGTVTLNPTTGSYLLQVPGSTAANTVTPTTNSVVGLTVNATSGTSAVAAIFNQANNTSPADTVQINTTSTGTQTNGLLINHNSAGTTQHALNVTNTTGTVTDAIYLNGTFTNLINASNFVVSNAGVVTVQGGQARDIVTAGATALTIDTGGAAAINIGNSTPNANAINLNQNTIVASGKNLTVTAGATSLTGASAGSGNAVAINTGATTNVGLYIQGVASQTANLFRVDANGVANALFTISPTGAFALRNSTDSTTAFNIKTSTGNNLLTVDTSGSQVGINLGSNNLPTATLDVNGTSLLRGSAVLNFTTPGASPAVIPAKFAIPDFDPGSNGQAIAVGIEDTAQATGRGIIVFDARLYAHAISMGVGSPDEASIVGFNWNGANPTGFVQTMDRSDGAATRNISLQSGAVSGGAGTNNSGSSTVTTGTVAGGTGQTTGYTYILTGDGAGTNSNTGNVVVDSGAKTGTGTAGVINIGITNASAVNISRTGILTTVNGTLTVAEAATLNGDLTIGNANTDRLTVTSQILGQDALVFQGATDNANTTTFRFTDPTGSNIITFPDATGTVVLNPSSGFYLQQVPTSNSAGVAGANVVSPTAAGIVGLAVNATTNGTTSAQAATFTQGNSSVAALGDTVRISSTNTANTQTNLLLVERNGAGGTTTNGIQISSTAGTLTNGLTINAGGTISAGIKFQGAGGFGDLINAGSFFTVGGGGVISTFGGATADLTTPSTTTANALTVKPGSSSANSGTGAAMNVQGGTQTGTTSTGGAVNIQGGTGTSTNGAVNINASFNAATNINTGTSTGAVGIGNSSAGAITLQSGGAINSTAAAASTISTTSGLLTLQGAGGVTARSANAAGAATSGVTIQSGNVTSGAFASGNVTIDVGTSTGTLGAINIGHTGVITTVDGTLRAGTSAGTGAFLNNGSTVNTALAVTDRNGGNGTWLSGTSSNATTTVDIYTYFTVNQTTASQTLQIPTPTSATAGRIIYISNIGSTSLTLLSSTLTNGVTATLIWNGSAWTYAGADGNSILNQNSTSQVANFRIQGTGQIFGPAAGTNTLLTLDANSNSSNSGLRINTVGTSTNAIEIYSGVVSKVVASFDNAGDLFLGSTGVSGSNAAGSLVISDGDTTTPQTVTVLTASALTGNRTLTLPDVTGTALVLQSSTPGTAQSGNINVSGTSILSTLQVGASAGTGSFTNNGTTLNTVTTQSSGSNVSISNINSYTAFVLTATAGSITYTLPDPSPTTAGKVIYISNAVTSSNAFTLAPTNGTSILLNTGATATLMWNGSRWTYAGTDTSNLQNAYTNSTGSTTPEIILDSTRTGVDIQDTNGGLGSTTALLAVRAGTVGGTKGNPLLTVTNSGGNTGTPLVGIGVETASRALHVQVSNTTINALPVLIDQTNISGDSGLEVKNAGQSFHVGIDSSDSNKFKISSSTSSGGQSILGSDIIGASSDSNDSDTLNAVKWVASTSGTISTSYAYVGSPIGSNPNNRAKMAIYSHNGGGYPSAPLGISNETTLTGDAWNSFTFGTPVSITAGTTYWVAYNTNGTAANQNNLKFTLNGSPLGAGDSQYYTAGITYASNPFPTNSGAGTSAQIQRFSMYAVVSGSYSDSFAGSLFQLSTTGSAVFQNSANSTSAFQILNAAGSNALLQADTTNGRVGINLASTETPGADLSFGGAADRTINVLQRTTTGTGRGLTIQAGQGNAGTGGLLTLNGGAGQGTNQIGGGVTVGGGASTGNAAGGAITLTGGTGGTTGTGGAVNISGGTGGSTSGAGGAVTVQGGTSVGAAAGGALTLQGGASNATAGSNGGTVAINGRNGSTTGTGGTGGAVSITAGNAGGSAANAGGAISITAGNATSTGTAGAVTITAGAAGGNAAGGAITLQAGAAAATAGSAGGGITLQAANGTSTSTGGIGGTLTLTAGNAGGSGNNAGGNIVLNTGTATGSGTAGFVSLNTPTAQFTEVTGTRTLTVQTRTTNVAGTNLTISAGTGGSGASAVNGGNLTLQGGNAAGTGNTNGGGVSITGGTGVGTGVLGLVSLAPTTFVSSGSAQSIGTSTSVTGVDTYSTIAVNATAASLTITVPVPNATNQVIGRILYVSAVNGTNDFSLALANTSGVPSSYTSVAMKANSTATLIWNGFAWTAAGASSSTDLQSAYNNTLTSAGGAELVLNAPGGNADGLTIRNNGTTPIVGALLEVQSSIGSNLFSVNSNATEYANNGGAENSTFTMWGAAPAGGTASRYTTAGANIATGAASTFADTSSTANTGVKNTLSSSLTQNLKYKVSYTVRHTSSTISFTTLDTIFSADGTSTTATCASGSTAYFNVWTRVDCTFTATSVGASNAIIIRHSDAVEHDFYIDNLSVTISADVNHAADGSADVAANIGGGTNNWAAVSGSTVTQTTSILYDSSGAVSVATAATAGRGVYNRLTNNIAPSLNTQYRVAFYARGNGSTANIAVTYTPNNGTNNISCQDYNTQTIAASAYTLISCYFTSDGTAVSNAQVRITQSSGAATTFYVDALTVTLNSNTASNLQVGGANKGGPTTLFTLDRSASPPIAANNDAYLGSMYYDITTGRIQCYETDGWGACGAAPDTTIVLTPEYTGAVLNGNGIGTMTADFCSNQSTILTVNTTFCASGLSRNYYKWTSPQASLQTYSIYVSYKLPSTFKTFNDDSTINITALTDSTTNGSVTYEVFRSTGSAVSRCYDGVTNETAVTSIVNTWQTVPVNGNEATGCGFTAGDNVIFKINVKAQSNASVYVENLTFTYTNK